MRVLLSNASPAWGGVHQVTEVLARGLIARGHDVLLLCRPRSRLLERMDGVVAIEAVLSGMDFQPRTLWRVHRALRRFQPDVALALTKKDVRLTGPVAVLHGVPLVVRHANDRPLRNARYHRLLYGRLPTRHVANSAATRATLLESAPWLNPDRVSVIHNGIDPEAFDRPAADLALPNDAVAIGFVGRFDRRKGVLDLADAWPAVATAVPHAWLVLVGEGTMETEMRRRLAAAPRVRWLGRRTDVAALMKAFDLVAMPSHWEGFGLVALESMAAGRPVVGADASSLPEIVRHGIEGILVPPRSPEHLSAALIELATSPELRRRMGESGRERAATDFSLSRMMVGYEQLLGEVVI